MLLADCSPLMVTFGHPSKDLGLNEILTLICRLKDSSAAGTEQLSHLKKMRCAKGSWARRELAVARISKVRKIRQDNTEEC